MIRTGEETLGLKDTGIIEPDTAKEYLLRIGRVSAKVINDLLVQFVVFVSQ